MSANIAKNVVIKCLPSKKIYEEPEYSIASEKRLIVECNSGNEFHSGERNPASVCAEIRFETLRWELNGYLSIQIIWKKKYTDARWFGG